MRTLKILQSAGQDFQKIYNANRTAAGVIGAFVEEAKTSQDILDTFTVHGHGSERLAEYHVSKWLSQQQKGRNLWRVKIWKLDDQKLFYRIVYAFDPPAAHYILGVTTHDQDDEKDFYDDETHWFTRRVIDVYDARFGK